MVETLKGMSKWASEVVAPGKTPKRSAVTKRAPRRRFLAAEGAVEERRG